MAEKKTSKKQPKRVTREDFETIEKITPIAQLLTDWGRLNVDDLGITSTVIFETMGNTLWEVYDEIGCRLGDFE